MSNNYWHQISSVTSWVFKRFFKWKQELMSYGIMIVIILATSAWQNHIADGDNTIVVAVSDEIREVMPISEHERFEISYFLSSDLEDNKVLVGSELDALIHLTLVQRVSQRFPID